MGGLDHAFSVLQGITLESDLVSNSSNKGTEVGSTPGPPTSKSTTPRALTFALILFTKRLFESEMESKPTDWLKKDRGSRHRSV